MPDPEPGESSKAGKDRPPVTEDEEDKNKVDVTVYVIHNPTSGRPDGKRYLKLLLKYLHQNFTFVEQMEITPSRSPAALAALALAHGATRFVVVGGDGTVAAVAGALTHADPDVCLTVAPRGTANAFAVALGLPHGPRAVAAACARNETRAVDVGRFETGTRRGALLLLAGVGLEADAVAATRRHAWLKSVFGPAGYMLGALRCVFRGRRFTAEVELKDVSYASARGGISSPDIRLSDVRLQALTVANAAPPASLLAHGLGDVNPSDGYVETVLVGPASVPASLFAFGNMLRGGLLGRRVGSVFGLRAKSVTVTCTPAQPVVVDGEDAGVTPLKVVLGEGQVNIVAPAERVLARRKRQFRGSVERAFVNLRGVAILAVAVFVLRRYPIGVRCGTKDADDEGEEA